jgi:hypothetical protein
MPAANPAVTPETLVWLSCHVYLLDMLIELGNQPNVGGFGCTDMKRLHVNRDYDLNVAEPG